MSRKNNVVALVSVCVSFAVMVVAIAVVDGFKYEIRSKVTGFMGGVMLVNPGMPPVNEEYPFPGNLSYRDTLLQIRGVESVNEVAYRSGLVKTDDKIEGLCFKGVEREGGDINDVEISESMARRLSLKVGDKMVVYFIGDDVKVRKFTISSLYNAQLDEIDGKFAIVDIRQVRRLNGWGNDDVSCLEIMVSSKADIDAVERQVRDMEYLCSTDDDTPLFVTSAKKLYAHLFDWLALLDLNVLMILALMIIVAGFNMISAILIIIFEKISMVGLLKSLGMTSKEVGKVFLHRSASLIGKGLLIGNAAGIIISIVQKYTRVLKLDSANYFVDAVPIDLNIWKIIAVDAAAFALIILIVSISTKVISRISPDRTMKME